MYQVGRLFQSSRGQEQEEFTAAWVVQLVNEAVYATTGIDLADARAVSVRRGETTIVVSHSAIAGHLQQSADQIIEAVNNKLRKVGGPRSPVRRLITRLR